VQVKTYPFDFNRKNPPVGRFYPSSMGRFVFEVAKCLASPSTNPLIASSLLTKGKFEVGCLFVVKRFWLKRKGSLIN